MGDTPRQQHTPRGAAHQLISEESDPIPSLNSLQACLSAEIEAQLDGGGSHNFFVEDIMEIVTKAGKSKPFSNLKEVCDNYYETHAMRGKIPVIKYLFGSHLHLLFDSEGRCTEHISVTRFREITRLTKRKVEHLEDIGIYTRLGNVFIRLGRQTFVAQMKLEVPELRKTRLQILYIKNQVAWANQEWVIDRIDFKKNIGVSLNVSRDKSKKLLPKKGRV
jgi:hypothetical protein